MIRTAGIYAIRNLLGGKVYVGSAKDIADRWRRHRSSLNDGRHHSIKLQRAWAKYGADSFELVLLEEVPEVTHLIEREQAWIDQLKAVANGYNVCPVAGSCLGVKVPREVIAKRAARPVSDETRRRMSEAQKGRKHSAEWCAMMSALHRGKTVSSETRKRLSDAHRNISEATREKMRFAARNRSPEHNERIARASKGRTHGPIARAKLSVAFKGRIVSAETRARMSAAMKASCARRKLGA